MPQDKITLLNLQVNFKRSYIEVLSVSRNSPKGQSYLKNNVRLIHFPLKRHIKTICTKKNPLVAVARMEQSVIRDDLFSRIALRFIRATILSLQITCHQAQCLGVLTHWIPSE